MGSFGWSAALAVMVAGSMGSAPPVAAQAVAAKDAQATVDAVRAAIRSEYVVPEKRGALDAVLARGWANGRYSGLEPSELAKRITDDMFSVVHDKHLGLTHNPDNAARLGSRPVDDDETPEQAAFFRDLARRNNHGVVEMKVLDGNVRVVAYNGFMWTGEESAEAIDAAMRFLKGGDAAIIDLRRNGGGSPDAVRRMASWFVPGGTKLVTFHMRSDPPEDSVTPANPPGQISGIPVYVLTSGGSASAAEEFAGHVAVQGFGTLVGATTAGAGYRNALMGVTGGYVLSISVGRAVLPNGKDWEGTGIAPAIAVDPDLALVTAQADALGKIAAKAQGPQRKELEWAAARAAAQARPVTPALALDRYAGRFGPRVIAVEGDRLTVQRDGGPKSTLVALTPDEFTLEMDARVRIRPTVVGGAVTAITVERLDGMRSEDKRS